MHAGWGHGHHRHGHHGPHGHHGEHGDRPDFRGEESRFGGPEHGGDWGGGAFGVRRPLRFLADRLDLSDSQIGELAKVLDDLKTERAQHAVDHRRSTASFADVLGGEAFDEARAQAAATERVKSAERLRDALVKALGAIHALLDPKQRERLAYLIRTGALQI
jgi:Spy/CpxP family protein refolding chaperone